MDRAGCWFNIPTIIDFSNEKWPADKHSESIRALATLILSLIHSHYFIRAHTYSLKLSGTHTNWNLLHKLFLSHSQWKSVRKPHCFDRRHMRSRRGVCQFFNHLAADDLWNEWPCHDKVSELYTFNYRSEGITSGCSIHHKCYWFPCDKCVCPVCVCRNVCV